ncbi:hypothetical protein [Spirillospora sp. NPDC029432]|uniref:hypothetical protein n=1 Tax=Spirillospora sp. NPDC029432 TaxID=3154599 RepID=UPI003451A841
MSGGARHGIGVVVGLVATPIIAVCLMYGTDRTVRSARLLIELPWSQRLPGAAALLVAAVLIGFLMGSRLSPVASAVPGVVFSVIGLLWVAAPRFSSRHLPDLMPGDLARWFLVFSVYGGFLLVGVALLAASAPPSRWRSAAGAGRGQAPRYAGPMGPGGQGAPPVGPPGGQPGQYAPQAHPQQPYGTPPPAPGAPPAADPNPPAQPYGTPPPADQGPFGAPPAAPPAAPEPGAPRYGSGSDQPGQAPAGGSAPKREQPGEWTQMYGGDDLRGD